MRSRHTSRTDPSLDGDRKQVSFRLNQIYRDRIDDVLDSRELPDVRSVSDVMQDALWLWFHEYDLLREKGMINGRSGSQPVRTPASEAGHPLGGTAEAHPEEVPGMEVGESPSAS